MKVPIEVIRRRELSEAAFAVMTQHGLSGTTVGRVAERAGMSQGLVHHYFESKADLLEAAMWEITRKLRRIVIAEIGKRDTPRGRIDAIVEAFFTPEMFRQHFAQAWLSFCGEAAFNAAYARIQWFMFNRMESNIAAQIRLLLPAGEVRPTARLICMQSHGIWLRCALDRGGVARDEALGQMTRLIDTLLGVERPAGTTSR